jgi:hypothetical protein
MKETTMGLKKKNRRFVEEIISFLSRIMARRVAMVKAGLIHINMVGNTNFKPPFRYAKRQIN